MTERGPVIPEGSEAQYDRFHFAPAFAVGNTVYVSGVIGQGADGKVPDDPEAEFTLAFDGVARVLESAGCTMADIVEMTTFHTDMPDSLGTFMKVKDRSVEAPYPAWTAIGCTALAVPNARLEVKVTAVRRDA